MNTYFRIALAPALALAATLPLATPAVAGEKHEDIVVTSRADLKAWQADATTRLNRALERFPRQHNSNPSSGIVRLTFEMGADGKPTNIKTVSNSTNWVSVRAARYAVRRLGDISDVPVTNVDDARFLANIIFANSFAEHDKLARELERAETARIASSGEGYIVLGG
ncbi:MAG: energy transducer TonB [Erythrobacter sp.]